MITIFHGVIPDICGDFSLLTFWQVGLLSLDSQTTTEQWMYTSSPSSHEHKRLEAESVRLLSCWANEHCSIVLKTSEYTEKWWK